MHINPSIYSGKPFQCLLAVLLQVIEVCHCKFDMVKTKQTKRKSESEKERWEKYRIAKVPSGFGTAAKVATHGPPVLPGQPGSARNLPDYHGKYFILIFILSKLNTVYVKGVERNKNTYTCCVLTHVEGVERNKNTCTCCMLTHVEGVKSTCTKCNCTKVIVFNREFQTK